MRHVLCLIIIVSSFALQAQMKFTRADSLRGALRPERTCYDVKFYHLDISVDLKKQRISGSNEIHFLVRDTTSRIQIDLYDNLDIEKILWDDRPLTYEREFNAVFVDLPQFLPGEHQMIEVFYSGKPKVSNQPPWDGGFVWEMDEYGNPWIGVACEGDGASLWWPNKDHLSDEPDSMSISVEIPENLFCVANGRLRSVEPLASGRQKFYWHVQYPINNYNVTINIADYAHFTDTYQSADGSELEIDYYVLKYNLEKAQKHFQQTHGVLESFEHYFGKYPYWKDGFCMVETPYLGMEHQGAIAYGNQYQRGYLGSMIPRDMHFDYIIVHETGHEYWGNCISADDMADLWIHESFTTYMEALYVEHQMGKAAAIRYLLSQRPMIMNRQPIMAPRDVNFNRFVGSDHYYKGAWILHTLRNTMDSDEQWFGLLKKLYTDHACSIVRADQITSFFTRETGRNYADFFEQYLERAQPPELHYQLTQKGKKIVFTYRWDANVIEGFRIPIFIGKDDEMFKVYPTKKVQKFVLPFESVRKVEISKESGYFKAVSKQMK